MSKKKKQESFMESVENGQNEFLEKANKKFKGKLIKIISTIILCSTLLGGVTVMSGNVKTVVEDAKSIFSSGEDENANDKINITLVETSKTNASTIDKLIETNKEKDKEISNLKKQVEELKKQLETKQP